MFSLRSYRLLNRSFTKGFSTKESFVNVCFDREGIALISMRRQPVNSLNLSLLQELNSTLDEVKKEQCNGLVITSAARVFSAGIDLAEFNNPEPERLRVLWSEILNLFLKLYATTETTSAVALNGYTAAGGCVVSLLCDYRVMVPSPKASIGLNDSLVGIVPRPWISELMKRTMGPRQAEIALTASTMYSAEEAVKVSKAFSAGVDLSEFNPDPDRLRIFWSNIQDLFFNLYATTETTSAVAINGFTAAGGCVLSLMCDYRVMVTDPRAKIIMNESMVGIVPRPWICALLNRALGPLQTEITLTASKTFTAEEARKVNLVDETAADKEEAIEKCKQFIREYNKIPTPVRARIKRSLRQNTIDMVEKNREQDIQQFTEEIMNPYVQERIRMFTEQIKSKNKN